MLFAGAGATQVVTRPLRKAPEGTETERSALLRQNSNTSVDTLEAVNTSMQDISAYSTTPPVILTQRDFYDSTDSTRAPLLASDAPVAEPVFMGAEARDDPPLRSDDAFSDEADETQQTAKPPENLSQLLVDFTSEKEPVPDMSSLNPSTTAAGGDDVSIATYDSTSARASRTGSMTNLASFADRPQTESSARNESPPAQKR